MGFSFLVNLYKFTIELAYERLDGISELIF